MTFGCLKQFSIGLIFIGVTSWYQSLGLSELKEHLCESSFKSRKDLQNDF